MLGADLIIENKSFARGARQPCGTYADPLYSTSVIWQADVMLDQLFCFFQCCQFYLDITMHTATRPVSSIAIQKRKSTILRTPKR